MFLVRSELLAHFSVCKYFGDSMVWIKLAGIYKIDVYICFVYIALENCILQYYDIDPFDNLLCDIAKYSDMGVLILAGDFNSQVVESKEYVEYEMLAYHMLNNITACLSYDKDYTCSRRSEDKQVVNYLNYVEPLVADYVMAGFPGTLGAYIGSRVIYYV